MCRFWHIPFAHKKRGCAGFAHPLFFGILLFYNMLVAVAPMAPSIADAMAIITFIMVWNVWLPFVVLLIGLCVFLLVCMFFICFNVCLSWYPAVRVRLQSVRTAGDVKAGGCLAASVAHGSVSSVGFLHLVGHQVLGQLSYLASVKKRP